MSETIDIEHEERPAPVRHEGLFVTDAELIRRIGVPEKIARDCLRKFDSDPRKYNFPQKQAFWGNRRYWPAVKAFLDRSNGLKVE